MVLIMRLAVTPVGQARLDVGERLTIGAEVIGSYCAARWWIARLSLPDAVAAARSVRRSKPVVADGELDAAGARLGRAVQRTLWALPVDSRCLVTALVLTRMLARRGIDSVLVIGVRSRPRFVAHAWVERGGVALLPTSDDYHRLSEF
jgi:Transglutaminase-like superfamily